MSEITSPFDQATQTSYLGKSERGTHVFTGVASTVGITLFYFLKEIALILFG